jgi:hypothetical protein
VVRYRIAVKYLHFKYIVLGQKWAGDVEKKTEGQVSKGAFLGDAIIESYCGHTLRMAFEKQRTLTD